MSNYSAEITATTGQLRRDWTFLEQFDLPTQKVKDRSTVFIRKLNSDGMPKKAYVKIYANKKHPLSRIFRHPRSRIEVCNLLYFKSIGISTPRVIAWGVRRNCVGRATDDFIITEAEEGTVQLDEFFDEHCPDDANEQHMSIRMNIAKILGQWTAVMHSGDFIHEDLKWRNILVRGSGNTPQLFWIDCPKGKFIPPWQSKKRKKLKDCATLDKLGRIKCRKQERRAFLAAYLGEKASSEQMATLCNEIESYRKKRFDAKDDQQRRHAEETIQS